MTHTGKKPYQCQYCEKVFSHKTNLIAHTRAHTGEELYHCSQYNKDFAQSNEMKSHIYAVSVVRYSQGMVVL